MIVQKWAMTMGGENFSTVIEWLEKEVEKSNYRRLKPLLSLLKGFDLSQWRDGEMEIVHYGY